MKKNHKLHSVRLRWFLSDQLRFYSNKCNESQFDIASDIGIDPSNLSRLLHGKYSYGIDIFLAVVDRYGLVVKLSPKYESSSF